MKTDKTKNWTDSWKEQLDEYSVTPPPEVWEELSKELAPRRIPLRKRTIWWAAACITLLLCTFIGLQFLRPTTDLNNLPLQTKISGSEQMEVSRMQNTVPSIKQKPLIFIRKSGASGAVTRPKNCIRSTKICWSRLPAPLVLLLAPTRCQILHPHKGSGASTGSG